MTLSDIELRVLGALVEKERTTPDTYPLSLQALVTASNQRTNRDPVTDHHLQEVRDALQRLRDRGLVTAVLEAGDRVPKYRHLLAQALALLAVLLLRDARTAAELRARTERYGGVPELAAVKAVLAALARRDPPLVRNVGREPGQTQDRWAQALGADESRLQPRLRGTALRAAGGARSGPDEAAGGLAARLTALEDRVAALEARLAEHAWPSPAWDAVRGARKPPASLAA